MVCFLLKKPYYCESQTKVATWELNAVKRNHHFFRCRIQEHFREYGETLPHNNVLPALPDTVAKA